MKKKIYFSLIAVAVLFSLSACNDDDNSDSTESNYTMQIVARGADLNGTVSVNFNPADDMFVIDAFSNRILKMNPVDGEILETITEKLDGPADIDFDSNGTMYLANPFSGEVYKRTAAGETSFVAGLNTTIDGIAVNDEGRVFTASFVPDEHATWELDPNGVQTPVVKVEKGGFDAFDFGPDGFLYAPDYLYGTGEVYKINVDTGDVSVVTDGLCQPISTKFNSIGELFVIDTLCSKIYKIDVTTGEKTLVANVDPGADNFDFNANDEMFVAFNADSYIGEVLPDGTVRQITTPGLSSPGSIAIRSDGTLFVADGFAMRRYDANTMELQQSFYNTTGMIPPFTLYDDGDNLILSCHLFAGVQIWNPIENQAVDTQVGFQKPTNAIRFRGDVIVADAGDGTVVKLDDRSPLLENLKVPAGLVANGDDLYVGDWETGEIWKVVESSEQGYSANVVVDGLANPEGLAFDLDGTLLVVEVGEKRLLRVDLNSGDKKVVVDNLDIGLAAPKGTASTWVALSSVAVSASGDLYVTGDVGNVIYKLEKK